MDQEKKLLIYAFTMHYKKLKTALNCTLPNPKNSEASEKVRKEGNGLFVKKNHNQKLHAELLSLYNRSACLAPSASQELAFAYANRCAFLLHIGKYKECILDIDKALKITSSTVLKVKLLCRKAKCGKYLDNDTWSSSLGEAQSLVDIISNDDENKQKLQLMIDEVTEFLPSKAEKFQDARQTIKLPVTDNMLEKVSIRHNEKYGRHLVAEENYNPGDAIIVEKLFSISVKLTHRYTNCHHCLKTCWSGVPCEHCNWAIFCSENCSEKAWKEYHYIECSIVHLLNNVLDEIWNSCYMSIKVLINAIEDAGSIENLRTQLEAVDECTDFKSKGFYKEGLFLPNTVESIYSLTQSKLTTVEKLYIPEVALMFLAGLLRRPQFKNIYDIKKMEDIISNKDIVFLGSLFIKFTAILLNNGFAFSYSPENSEENSYATKGNNRGICLASLISLVNNSCCPNADVCFTEDGKIILFALEPIKKNSQIFISYTNHYHSVPLTDRIKDFMRYNFICDCQACTECWPPVLLAFHLGGDYALDDNKAEFIIECNNVNEAVVRDLSTKSCSQATIGKLGEKITLSFEKLKQPSALTCLMQNNLYICFTNVYNGLKPQLHEKCNKWK